MDNTLEDKRAELTKLDNLRKLDPHNKQLLEQRNKLATELGEPYIIIKDEPTKPYILYAKDKPDDPRLDPSSPAFSQEEWEKYIDSIDWGIAFKNMEKSLANAETIQLNAVKAIQQIMDALNPEGLISSVMDAVAAATESIGTAIQSGVVEGVIDNLAKQLVEMSPEELEALQADIDEEKLDKALEENKDQLQLPEFEAETKKRKKRANSGKALAAFREKVAEETTALIYQNAATNIFSKIKTDKRNTSIDPVTGKATITSGKMKVEITNFVELAGLNTSTHKLLDILKIKFTEDPHKSPYIVLPLAEYMERRGLKDRKSAREQVVKDLETLYNASVSFQDERGRAGGSFLDMRLCDAKGVVENGKIIYVMGHSYAQMLINGQLMPYPLELLQLNDNKNPHSYYLGRKIAELKNMNAGRERDDIISVKTLLASCPDMPSYEQVMSGNGNIADRIIKPFERDMDALEDKNLCSWEYCHSKGEPLTQEELDNFSYDIFINCLVKIDWRGTYPDQTERLAERQKKIDKANKSKEKQKRKPRTKKTAESN